MEAGIVDIERQMGKADLCSKGKQLWSMAYKGQRPTVPRQAAVVQGAPGAAANHAKGKQQSWMGNRGQRLA